MFERLARRLGFARMPEPTPEVIALAPLPKSPTPEPAPRVPKVRAPMRRQTPVAWKPARLSPAEHARRLLAWCQQEDGGVTGEVLACDLVAIHAEMCGEWGLEVRPWNPIARELTLLTTGRKSYRWVRRDDGLHRLRVYVIPPAPAVADSAPRYRSIHDVSRRAA